MLSCEYPNNPNNELLLVINLRVETLIQSGRCQLSAPSMHKVKTGVQNRYMKYTCTAPRISDIISRNGLYIGGHLAFLIQFEF